MTIQAALIRLTLRALLGRRRSLLLVLLAALPILVALLARIGGGTPNEAGIVDLLVVRTVLPLTALVFGTAALGSELDDGTAVYILTKPIPRWQVVLAKLIVAGGLTAALTAASAFVTGLLIGSGPDSFGLTAAFTIAVAIGSFAYVAAFLAVSVLTSRALIIGLFYTLIWEAALAGLLAGTRILSIREATLGLGRTLAPAGTLKAGLDTAPAVALVAIVLVGGFLLASRRLARFEVRGQD